MESKEDKILELFFNNPTREWHFEEVIDKAGVSRSKAAGWLKVLAHDKIIKKVKEKGKMPYYISNHESYAYRNRKKLFALEKLNESGLLEHLSSLKKTKAVILFGSFARSDWNEKSDIDVFIYGEPDGLKIAEYESKLHRDIQLFICKTKNELKKLGEGLIRNIIKGNIIQGDIDFVRVKINA